MLSPIILCSNLPRKVFPRLWPKSYLKDCSAAYLLIWTLSRINRISFIGEVVAKS